jgi:hypothetical protein
MQRSTADLTIGWRRLVSTLPVLLTKAHINRRMAGLGPHNEGSCRQGRSSRDTLHRVAGQRNECPILRSTPLSSLDDMAISSAMSPREPAAPAPSAKSTTAKMMVASTVKCEPPTSILKKRLEGRARHAGRAPLSDGHRRVVQLRPCVDVNTKALIVTAL